MEFQIDLYSAQIQAQQGKIYYLLSIVYIQHKKMLMLMSETNQDQLVLIQNQQVLIQNLEVANQNQQGKIYYLLSIVYI